MRCRASVVLLILFAWPFSTGAGTDPQKTFDPEALPVAFPGAQEADEASLVADIRHKLPPHMSVLSHGNFVIAAPGSAEEAILQGKQIADYDAQIRRRSFPRLERRRMLVILGDDTSGLERLIEIVYPVFPASETPPSGFYHPKDRLILTTTVAGYGALVRELTRALVQDDNPDAPHWFEEAMVTLYESSDWRVDRLTPVLDRRMELISPDEDLAYDIFAGICDCSEVSAEQLALMRLLLIFLDERDELMALHEAIKEQGRYTTLLQALDAMDFDRVAWKEFAEHSVRAYSR